MKIGDPVRTRGGRKLGIVTAIIEPTYVENPEYMDVMVRNIRNKIETLYFQHELVVCNCAERNPKKKKQVFR